VETTAAKSMREAAMEETMEPAAAKTVKAAETMEPAPAEAAAVKTAAMKSPAAMERGGGNRGRAADRGAGETDSRHSGEKRDSERPAHDPVLRKQRP
jgi:hypothetical protein